MLDSPSKQEEEVLGAIKYQRNDALLHFDDSILPKRKNAWSSWNYLLDEDPNRAVALTYNMNILQRLNTDTTFCVTLNKTDSIDPTKILRTFKYSHPQFDKSSLAAQQQRSLICGHEGIHFCGAYWYNGFHEDGVKSALDVCERFGETL